MPSGLSACCVCRLRLCRIKNSQLTFINIRKQHPCNSGSHPQRHKRVNTHAAFMTHRQDAVTYCTNTCIHGFKNKHMHVWKQETLINVQTFQEPKQTSSCQSADPRVKMRSFRASSSWISWTFLLSPFFYPENRRINMTYVYLTVAGSAVMVSKCIEKFLAGLLGGRWMNLWRWNPFLFFRNVLFPCGLRFLHSLSAEYLIMWWCDE